jgi:hypothetical protein
MHYIVATVGFGRGRRLRSFIDNGGADVLRESLGVTIQEPKRGSSLSFQLPPRRMRRTAALLNKIPAPVKVNFRSV